MPQKERQVMSLLAPQSLPTSKLSGEKASTLVGVGATLTVCLRLSSACLLYSSPLCICHTSTLMLPVSITVSKEIIELLQPPRRVAGGASSVAGNLVRKGKKPRRNCKSSLSAAILGNFPGKEGKIVFLSL